MTLLEKRKKENKMLCLNDTPLAGLNDFFSNQTEAMKQNRFNMRTIHAQLSDQLYVNLKCTNIRPKFLLSFSTRW